ncbi:hypothetical protein [Paraburkholderia sp. CI3]
MAPPRLSGGRERPSGLFLGGALVRRAHVAVPAEALATSKYAPSELSAAA